MKKHKIVLLLALITLIVFSIYVIYSSDKYREIESTDLSQESIGGLSLMDKYNKVDIEKKFGQLTNEYKKNSSYIYEFQSQKGILFLKVDKDNNIVRIELQFKDSSIETDRGMTKVSTFYDITEAYGNKYLKEENKDFMGRREYKEISYVDKKIMSKISFMLYEYEDWTLGHVVLSRY